MANAGMDQIKSQVITQNIGSENIQKENKERTKQESYSCFALKNIAGNDNKRTNADNLSQSIYDFSKNDNYKAKDYGADECNLNNFDYFENSNSAKSPDSDGASPESDGNTSLLEKAKKFLKISEKPEEIITTKETSACEGTHIEKALGEVRDYFDGETKDGEIGETKQGKTGDCWVLSGINSLSYTEEGRKMIKDALEYTDGGTIVHLEGAGNYFIPDELVTQTKGSKQYSSGDDDMIIFELAIEAALDDIKTGKLKPTEDAPWFIEKSEDLDETKKGVSSTEGGYNSGTIYLLTGRTSKTYYNEGITSDVLSGLEGRDDVALGVGNFKEKVTVKDINGKNVKIIPNHAYAVKELKDGVITLVNPWDSGKEIKLDYETFIGANPGKLYVTDLSISNLPKRFLVRDTESAGS